MQRLFDRDYFTPNNIAIFVLLAIAGILFIVLDWNYYILPPVWINKAAGQDRTIFDIARSLSIALSVMVAYFVMTRYHDKSFFSKLSIWLKLSFLSFGFAYGLAFLFCFIIICIYGF
jgi:hypothetical protein